MNETAEKPFTPETHALAPLNLIQAAIDKGVDADQLTKLLDLQERWEKSRAIEAYAAAMNLCQSEMPLVVRDAENSQTRSWYARLEAVQQQAKPIYSKHGFSLSFGEADCPKDNFKRIICDVRHNAGHCERYHLDLPIDGIGPKGNAIGGMNAVQGCVSTLSYGQRTLTCRIFNITVADEDKDGQGGYLTDEQTKVINDLIDELAKMKRPVDMKRFLAWLNVKPEDGLNTVPTSAFAKIVDFLQRKRTAK